MERAEHRVQGVYALAGRLQRRLGCRANRNGPALEGAAWSRFSSTNEDLHALRVGPAGDVWMAGTAGRILRRH